MPTAIEKLIENWRVFVPLAVALLGGSGFGVQTYRANEIGEAKEGNQTARFECSDQLAKEEGEHKVCRDNARTDTGALRDDLFRCLESGGTIRD